MTVDQFVEQFFQLIGARCEPLNNGLRVELTRQQLQQLEGRPRWGWSAPGDELTVLYFTFVPTEGRHEETDGPKVYPEFVGPGSFRLKQIVDAALRLWGLGRVFARPEGSRVRLWRPHLVFHFTLTYVARVTQRRTVAICVDLTTGDTKDFVGFAPGTALRRNGDGHPAESPSLSVGDAHERAVNHLCHALSAEDSQWSSEQQSWIDAEVETLQAYLRRAELEEDTEPLAAVRAARLTELHNMHRPYVQVRATAATVLYLPATKGETI